MLTMIMGVVGCTTVVRIDDTSKENLSRVTRDNKEITITRKSGNKIRCYNGSIEDAKLVCTSWVGSDGTFSLMVIRIYLDEIEAIETSRINIIKTAGVVLGVFAVHGLIQFYVHGIDLRLE